MTKTADQTKPVEPAPAESAAYLLNAVLDWMLEQDAQKIGEQWLERRHADLPEVLVVDGVLVQ
jgi:hypothetical protein